MSSLRKGFTTVFITMMLGVGACCQCLLCSFTLNRANILKKKHHTKDAGICVFVAVIRSDFLVEQALSHAARARLVLDLIRGSSWYETTLLSHSLLIINYRHARPRRVPAACSGRR